MNGLDFVLDRVVNISARRETVFRYFTDSARFAAWWGAGSAIEPRPGGRVAIRFPNGIEAGGEVLEILPPERIVFSYGFASGQPLPIGASRVTVTLEQAPDGTLVRLRHELPNAEVRDEHVQGWRYQLALFANVAAREQNQGVATLADRYFALWREPDAAKRRAELAAIADERLSFHDPYGCTEGLADLDAQIAACQRFMPGVAPERSGEARHCQGVALVPWVARSAAGEERAKGTNVFELAPDGRLRRVTGLWD